VLDRQIASFRADLAWGRALQRLVAGNVVTER
jgi:hypothetical protein